ncbi:Transcription factor PIF1-like protein, partial [Drosera capensis]
MDFQLPNFDIGDDDDDFVPAPTRHKNLHEDEEIMELVWQNGHIVAQIQNQNNPATMPLRQPPQASQPASVDHLFMQEDEMAAWLHFSPNDRQLYPDLLPPSPQPPPQQLPQPQPQHQLPPQPQQLPPSPPQPSSSVPSSTITIPESRRPIAPSARNLAHFSRVRVTDRWPTNSTVVESSETPALPSEIRSPEFVVGGSKAVDGASSADGGGKRREAEACGDIVVSSVEGKMKVPAVDRKRKGREGGDLTAGCHAAVEDVDKESAEAKRIHHETTGAKRSRSAEVHSLSERKRRDRINERMRTLQQLIPSCTKSDKASMLDEAIRYTNQLQMQVRENAFGAATLLRKVGNGHGREMMMSMGYGMPPIMFPGVQQYMPPTGMGMGMEATMVMSHPMMPFPHMLPSSGFLPPGSAPLLGPRFPLPTFPMPVIPAPGPSRAEASNQADPINTIGLQNSNMLHGLYLADPNYQRFLAMQQMQGQPSQPQ